MPDAIRRRLNSFLSSSDTRLSTSSSPPRPGSLPARPLTVAVLGASGAVGQELLQLLEERQFPVAELRLLASARSAGQKQQWKGQELIVQEVREDAFQGVDLVLASAGGSVSKQWRQAITDLSLIHI